MRRDALSALIWIESDISGSLGFVLPVSRPWAMVCTGDELCAQMVDCGDPQIKRA
jgi:hypothetical protein